MNAKVPLHNRLIVVSWPANSSSEVLTSTSCRVNSALLFAARQHRNKIIPRLDHAFVDER